MRRNNPDENEMPIWNSRKNMRTINLNDYITEDEDESSSEEEEEAAKIYENPGISKRINEQKLSAQAKRQAEYIKRRFGLPDEKADESSSEEEEEEEQPIPTQSNEVARKARAHDLMIEQDKQAKERGMNDIAFRNQERDNRNQEWIFEQSRIQSISRANRRERERRERIAKARDAQFLWR